MNEIKYADFGLQGFKISEFSFIEASDDFINLDLNFQPSGSYDENTGIYSLNVIFKATVSNEKDSLDIVKASLNAFFNFSEIILGKDIPPYFYVNSIAIVFPYLRAFISTLTFQSQSKLLILPLLNLSNLESTLKSNTKIVVKS